MPMAEKEYNGNLFDQMSILDRLERVAKKANCHKENIEYYTLWLRDGFLPREDDIPPIRYGEDKESNISREEIEFILRI